MQTHYKESMKYLLSFFAILFFGLTFFALQANAQQMVPDFKVESLEGKTFNSAELKGKIVVLNLWFVNCPHCIEEIKSLNTIVDSYSSNNDVVFIGLATNDKAQLAGFLKKYPFKYNVVPNAGDLMLLGFGDKQKDGSYFLPFPTHVVIDREGKIISKTSGLKGVDVVKSELAKQFGK